ncbi:hypothetical protein WJX74_003399 [Apatococcus lobatus]|uniref:Armadillo repeat-containing protein 8 n=1 Tax=Apatococcus lobatus TaxID=904363 RepID=A0AAW1RZN1_9CHLO
MVARPEELVSRLASGSDPDSRLKALRDIKNQSATAAGSLAYGSQQGAEAFLACNGLQPLLRTLWHSDLRVVEASLRALRCVFQNEARPSEQQVATEAFIQLVTLSGSGSYLVAVGAARLLPVFCTTDSQASLLEQQGGVRKLLHLSHAVHATQHEIVLEALARLTATWPGLMRAAFAEDDSFKRKIEEQLKSPSPEARFVACLCLANYCQGRSLDAHPPTLQSQVLPTLVRLLGNPAVRFSVPRCLNSIIEGSDVLQKVATDFEAIPKLAHLLHAAISNQAALLDLLQTLATLCQHHEANRRQLLTDHTTLKLILGALESPDASVRVAACSCLRGLSRSVKNLRCSLVDVDIAQPLMKLLSDPNLEVQQMATAVLCNMVLDFAVVKDVLVAAGCVDKLVSLATSMDSDLRLNAVWGLQNLAFRGSLEVKGSIMSALPWTTLTSLLRDESPELQGKALSLLQNLVHGSNTSMTQLTAWTGGNILEELAQVLYRIGDKESSLQEHAMQTLGNLAGIGGEDERDEIINNPGILSLLPTLLASSQERLRLAALWLVINIIPVGDRETCLAMRRTKLDHAGIKSIVQQLRDTDPSQDIRERATTACNRFLSIMEEPP